MQVDTQLMTFEEFEVLPDPREGHYELHHGRVILMPPPKKPHMKVETTIDELLHPLLRPLGFLRVELAFRPAPQYEYWTCDIGFISQSRWDADDNDYFPGAPDLVIEVSSKSNTMDEMLDRQDVCLDNGCISFWVVDAKRCTVMVTTPDRKTITYDRAAAVPLPEPYHGSVAVSEIFR